LKLQEIEVPKFYGINRNSTGSSEISISALERQKHGQ